ncbi:MAG: hypothetical protein DGJ47_000590 [Rickettsiaceae bacterium]
MKNKTIDYPEIPALSGKAKKLVVMLHGVGSDGNDLISLVPFINHDLKDYHFISPNGVEPFDMAPFGYQWFSLQDRSPEAILPQVIKNSSLVNKVIEDKQNELGLSNNDTILFGFSQGTMLSSYLTLSQNKPYHAMIGFSGRLIPSNGNINTKTPICLIHGLNDPVVDAEESKLFAQYCADHNIKHELKIIPNLSHSIDDSGIKFAINFLNNL